MNNHKCSVQETLSLIIGSITKLWNVVWFLLLKLIGERGDVFQVILIKLKPGFNVQFVDAAFPRETPYWF